MCVAYALHFKRNRFRVKQQYLHWYQSMAIFRCTWVSQFPYFKITYIFCYSEKESNPTDKGNRLWSFKRQCQSTGGKAKHWLQPRRITHCNHPIIADVNIPYNWHQ